jgi:hypothetical protein
MSEPTKNYFADDAPPPQAQPPAPPSGRETYNIVSDTAIGVNVRLWDNLFQLAAIVVCLLLGIGIGYAVSGQDPILGAVAGGFAGLLVGLFGSGIFLMIFRAVRHARGRHD